jgi:hypothetical protein
MSLSAAREKILEIAKRNGWDRQKTDELIDLMMSHWPDGMESKPLAAPAAGERGVHVYVLEEKGGGAVKVGVAASVPGRLFDLQSSNPRELSVAYRSKPFTRSSAMAVERAAHARLAEHRIRGEWFRCSADEAVAVVVDCGGIPE